MDFTPQLRRWYLEHKRDLPWRGTRDPYLIWLSEVILQQTRVEQGRNYYERFANNWPTVTDLAAAPIDAVMKCWQGLGYYSRARNLHATAQQVVKQHNGQFPATWEGLLALKGIGEYTAAAIGSFAFGLAEPVVDGNVYRVLSRVFGIETPIDSTAGKKEFRQLAAQLLDRRDPATHNQAIMEFGAVQCVPRSPDCSRCPFVRSCVAHNTNRIAVLPVKAKKTKVSNRYFHYFLLRHGARLYVKQRPAGDIWQALYDFPLLETASAADNALETAEWQQWTAKRKVHVNRVSETLLHVLSHQRLHVRFYEVTLDRPLLAAVSANWELIAEERFRELAVPALIHKYMVGREGQPVR